MVHLQASECAGYDNEPDHWGKELEQLFEKEKEIAEERALRDAGNHFDRSAGYYRFGETRPEEVTTVFSNEKPEPIEAGPCDGVRCNGPFQMPVPPSCECSCPSDVSQTCTNSLKDFNQKLCECVCRDININCPGKSDFNFDVCDCVCPLQEQHCGLGQRLNIRECTCETPTPPPPQCSIHKQLECQKNNKIFDMQTCECQCQRFMVKKTESYYNYRHSRSPLSESDFKDELMKVDDGSSRFRRYYRRYDSSRSRSHSGHRSDSSQISSKSDSISRSGQSDRHHYSMSCPTGKRVDHSACICYW